MNDDTPAEYLERLQSFRPKQPRFPKNLFFGKYGLRIWVETATILIATAVALSALFTFIVGATLFLDQRSCASKANGLGLAHKWGPLEDCLLRTPGGQYIPDSQYFINHPQP